MKKQRLSKVLAASGIASRRACETLIFTGRVQVNQQTVLTPQTLVSLDEDLVFCDGQKVCHTEDKVYYILNKPYGFICSNTPERRKKIVLSLLPQSHRLFTVGRLDRDTTGLLLITNDGHFSQKVIHPSSNIEKEYLVKVQSDLTEEHLESLRKGGLVEGVFVKPVKVSKVRKGTFKMVLKEGKKREVRVLTQKARLTIVELSRIRIGGLTLGSLPLGSYKTLTPKEKNAIFQ